jgi:hypothetical protein
VTSTAELARTYIALGIQPTPLRYQTKEAYLDGWPQLRITHETVPEYFGGPPQNIGGVMGTMSDDIVDIDFDWPEAADIGERMLPRTWTFGRGGNIRHMLVRARGAKTLHLDGPSSLCREGEKARVIELLSDGTQVMLPGSIHPEGQPVEWLIAPEACVIAEIDAPGTEEPGRGHCGCIPAGSDLADQEGHRHELAFALTGALHHAGWPPKRIRKLLIEGVFQIADDEERGDRIRAVEDTLRDAETDKAITGLPRLRELLPGDVVDKLVEWWGLGQGTVLTMGGTPLIGGHVGQYPASEIGPIHHATVAPQGIGGHGGQYPTGAHNVWPPLEEFECELPGSTAEYPVAQLGSLLGGAVDALVARQQVPTALAAQSILIASSAVVQPHFDVECDGRIVPTSLWCVMVAAPGRTENHDG